MGKGPAGEKEETKAQWYALWGLMPINEVDRQDMVDGATDYRIETQYTAMDYIISAFTGAVSIVRRSVTVVY